MSEGNKKVEKIKKENTATRNRKISIQWENIAKKDTKVDAVENSKDLLDYVRNNVIGDNEIFPGPYGYRKITYCDYIASGRSLKFIEDYITKEVMPLYANTHTTNSITGLQTTLFRYESRQIISNSLNCGKKDVVIFAGSGATAGLNKLVHMLAIKKDDERKPVVFVGPFNHHSNILPWRESEATIVNINLNKEGLPDIDQLKKELQKYKDSRLKIGAFAAASNVTGIMVDVDSICSIMHQHDGYSVIDYAAAAPYIPIDMNPVVEGDNRGLVYKDAIILSPHKFVGGPGSPGLLVAKKHMFVNNVPEYPGGGTVFFVTEKDHRYLKKAYEREEGGTPSIIGSIRAGLVFQLKNAIGASTIEKLECELIQKAFKSLKTNENILILGNTDAKRLSICSFMIKYKGLLLHHNFVGVLLNDLFGIQSRSGCACAGPYALSLLDIDYELAKSIESELLVDDVHEYLRPGFVRLNFAYFMDEISFDFVIEAIHFIANYGWKLLPHYTFHPETGEWIHHNNKKFLSRRWLGDISYQNGSMEYRTPVGQVVSNKELRKYMKEAYEIVNEAVEEFKKPSFGVATQQLLFKNECAEKLRWFLYPNEALSELRGDKVQIPPHGPFMPKVYVSKSKKEKLIKKETEKMEEPKIEEITEKPEEEEEENELMLLGDFVDIESEPSEQSTKKKAAELWPKVPEKELLLLIKKAIFEYKMIQDGDRILLGLSGGKDSLTLLHALHALQKKLHIKFEIGAMTVDPQTEEFDPKPLKKYLQELGVPYFYEEDNIIQSAKECEATSICSWCSRMKRGIMYNTCRREGYNVLVLGQHLDDLAESFIMSIFHNGLMRTQKANYLNDEGDIRIIRPMIYVRERSCKKFAWDNRLPVIDENCPACFEMPKSRQRIKTLLASQENLFPDLYSSLITAMKPLLQKDMQTEGDGKHPKFKKNDKSKWTIEKALSGKMEMPKGRSIEDLKKEQKQLQEKEKLKKEVEEKDSMEKKLKKEEMEKEEEMKRKEKVEIKTVEEPKVQGETSISNIFKNSLVYVGLMSISFIVGYKMKK